MRLSANATTQNRWSGSFYQLMRNSSKMRHTAVQRLLWILLAVLAGVLLLVARDDKAFAGLSQVDLASLAVKIVLVVVIGSGALPPVRERFPTPLPPTLIRVAIAMV